MSDFATTAATAEKKLEKLYLILSLSALFLAIIICTILLIHFGFSSFSIMMSIGSILMIMFITSAILFFTKKSIYCKIQQTLHTNPTSPQDSTESPNDNLSQFARFLNEHALEFELTHNLFNTYTKKP